MLSGSTSRGRSPTQREVGQEEPSQACEIRQHVPANPVQAAGWGGWSGGLAWPAKPACCTEEKTDDLLQAKALWEEIRILHTKVLEIGTGQVLSPAPAMADELALLRNEVNALRDEVHDLAPPSLDAALEAIRQEREARGAQVVEIRRDLAEAQEQRNSLCGDILRKVEAQLESQQELIVRDWEARAVQLATLRADVMRTAQQSCMSGMLATLQQTLKDEVACIVSRHRAHVDELREDIVRGTPPRVALSLGDDGEELKEEPSFCSTSPVGCADGSGGKAKEARPWPREESIGALARSILRAAGPREAQGAPTARSGSQTAPGRSPGRQERPPQHAAAQAEKPAEKPAAESGAVQRPPASWGSRAVSPESLPAGCLLGPSPRRTPRGRKSLVAPGAGSSSPSLRPEASGQISPGAAVGGPAPAPGEPPRRPPPVMTVATGAVLAPPLVVSTASPKSAGAGTVGKGPPTSYAERRRMAAEQCAGPPTPSAGAAAAARGRAAAGR